MGHRRHAPRGPAGAACLRGDDRGLPRLSQRGRAARRPPGRASRGHRHAGGGDGAPLRRARAPVVAGRPLRRRDQHAGHAGHGAQSRDRRDNRGGSRGRERRRGLRPRHAPALPRDVCAHRAQGGDRRAASRGDRGDMARGRGRGGGFGKRARSAGRSASRRRPRRLRLVERAARTALPRPSRAFGRRGHGGHAAGHGVRQSRREERNRRALQPQPAHRRARALRRVSRSCPGGGRGLGPADAAGPRCAGVVPARGARRPARRCAPAGSAEPGCSGHRVLGTRGRALSVADPYRRTRARRGHPHRGRSGERGNDLQGRGARARQRGAGPRRC